MLRYQNRKTNSLINIPDDVKIKDVDDYAYLIKIMIHHDELLIKQKNQQLLNCLIQVKQRKENKDVHNRKEKSN